MCEILEAVCSVLPRKVPGSCENCVDNQQGVMSSATAVFYVMWRGGKKDRDSPSVQELLKFVAEYLPELNGGICFLFQTYWKCPSKQLYPTLPCVKDKYDYFVFCLLITLNEMNKCWQNETEYHVLTVQ